MLDLACRRDAGKRGNRLVYLGDELPDPGFILRERWRQPQVEGHRSLRIDARVEGLETEETAQKKSTRDEKDHGERRLCNQNAAKHARMTDRSAQLRLQRIVLSYNFV